MQTEPIYHFRYISIIAVVASFFAAVLMFVIGAERTLTGFSYYLQGHEVTVKEGVTITHDAAAMFMIVDAVDAFLFGLVLLIFCFGVFNLCVRHIDGDEMEKVPRWLRVDSIGHLKTSLAQLIIVILFVNVLEFVIFEGTHAMTWTTLVIPLSVVLLAAALRLMHAK
ncbi:hypothetical protein ABH15_02035 [Methanoculleus taiwanensis]|uniref:YqhA family protein n=1 Tax=Methanoculleus taiwanensis TaxID=1550565 RepID=A0A498H4F9_9EURY|nr:YqhA family protein [Methanoculleus taiwanensis]RXE56948.1 hypothetical protein ABH15_02035 [Methanoculleus taiwanensis]